MIKKLKPENFLALFFLSILAFFIFFIFYNIVLDQIDKRIYNINKNVNINWEEKYPFREHSIINDNDKHIEDSSSNLYKYLKEGFDFYSTQKLQSYHTIVEAAKKYEDVIAWNFTSASEYNGIIELHDGYLTNLNERMDAKRSATAVIEFAEYCRENNIEFMYLNLPFKICKYDDANISGVLDFSNQNADELLQCLESADVKNYDFRKILHDDGMKHHEAFYITDHHWKAETGLWAAKHILEFLRDDFNWPVDPEVLNPERFRAVIYPECFLGSQGRKVTLSRTRPDDFTLLFPEYETRLEYEVPQANVNITGDFSVIYDMDCVNVKDYYKNSPYDAYDYGYQSLVHICNELNHDDKKILIIHDSFGRLLDPFIALGVKQLTELDLRAFNGSLKSYIESYKPNMIIIAYYSGVPGLPGETEGTKKDEDKKFYDFR